MNDQFGACDTIRLRDAESIHFLYAICSRDKGLRIQAIDNAERIIDGWLEGYGSPKESSFLDQSNGHDVENDTMKLLVREQLPDILRLSIQCPFIEVRDRCGQLLEDLKDRGIKIPRRTWSGPSVFIPDDEDTVTSRHLEQTDKCAHPHIVIAGEHPFSNNCYVLVESVVLAAKAPYRKALAVMFAAYYVLNVAYPQEAAATLEFIQRMFAGINQDRGSKAASSKGKKIRPNPVNPKVASLIGHLREFKTKWEM